MPADRRDRPPTLDELRAEIEADRIAAQADAIAAQSLDRQTRGHGVQCRWPDCREKIPNRMLMCKKHWYMVPLAMRDEIWRTYRPGQEINGAPSDEYLAAYKAVREWAAAFVARTSTEGRRANLKGGLG